MNTSPQLADRLQNIIQRRNRELVSDAGLKAGLGIAFSLVTFGMLWWFGWVIGFMLGLQIGLDAWVIATVLTALIFIVATWSAWNRVDPLAGLEPLSDAQMMLTQISQAAGGLGYFSARHASAGFAIVLLGGPVGVIEAFGIWAHRIRADVPLVEDAARLLDSCEDPFPVNKISNLGAAFLLWRLALVRIVPDGESRCLKLTDKGFNLRSKESQPAAKAKRRKE